MVKETETKVSVIIPAYNEESTVARVTETAFQNQHVDQVIVIDDGSSDRTREQACLAGAEVVGLEQNQGKALAMTHGIKHAKNNLVCFLDADLIGFQPKHLAALLSPILDGRADMNIGIRRRRYYLLNRLIRIFPLIGGERALTKELWQAVPAKYKKRFKIEIALNYHAKKRGYKTTSFFMAGVSQIRKENKHGFFRGFAERLSMMWDVALISFELYIIDRTKIFFKNLIKK